eukprot:2711126-Rhodomonas_salina.1
MPLRAEFRLLNRLQYCIINNNIAIRKTKIRQQKHLHEGHRRLPLTSRSLPPSITRVAAASLLPVLLLVLSLIAFGPSRHALAP